MLNSNSVELWLHKTIRAAVKSSLMTVLIRRDESLSGKSLVKANLLVLESGTPNFQSQRKT